MILITGATGTVGSEVVKKLSVQGIHARALTRDVAKVEADQFPHVEFVQGDFDDADSIRRACSGVEQAFLLSNFDRACGASTDCVRRGSAKEWC